MREIEWESDECRGGKTVGERDDQMEEEYWMKGLTGLREGGEGNGREQNYYLKVKLLCIETYTMTA